MTLKPNPRYDQFRVATHGMVNELAPWKGLTFRTVDLAFSRAHKILDGKGSLIAGGRWNGPASFKTIYSSLRPGTAIEEAYGIASRFGLSQADLYPRLTVGLEWDLAKTLDLTRSNLPDWIDLPSWLKEDFRSINRQGFETLAQAFGRACFDEDITGIFCPSALIPAGVNLVAFKTRIRRPHYVRVLEKDELRKFLK
jgi:RES domain-containing protein